jgi:MFS family permease
VPVLAAVSFVTGIGLAVHLTLWFTVFQQEVPAEAVSRVSSFDSLGSFVLIPLGSALTGPVADAIGERATLVAAGLINVACLAVIVSLPSVWAIRRDVGARVEPAAAPERA